MSILQNENDFMLRNNNIARITNNHETDLTPEQLLKQKQAAVFAHICQNPPAAGQIDLYSLFAERNVRGLLFSFLDLQSAARTSLVKKQYAAVVNSYDQWSLKAVAAREFPYLVLGAKWSRIKKIITKHPRLIDLMFQKFVLPVHGQKMEISPLEYACYVHDKYLLKMCNEAKLTEVQREQFNNTVQSYRPEKQIPTHEETLAESGYKVFMKNYVGPWLEEYELGVMSDKDRKPKFIYLECTDLGLKYEVIGLDDKLKKNTINWESLPKNFPRKLPLIMRSNGECLTAILNETSLAQHTKMATGVTIDSMREYLMTQTRQMSAQQNSYCLQPFYWVCEAYYALFRRWTIGKRDGYWLVTEEKLCAFWQKIDGYAKRHILTSDKRKIIQASEQADGSYYWAADAKFDEAEFPLDSQIRNCRKDGLIAGIFYIDPDCDDNSDDIFGEDYSIGRGATKKARCGGAPQVWSSNAYESGAPFDLAAFRHLDAVRRSYVIELCEQMDLHAAMKLHSSP